jgi:hypothetical protein
MKINTNELVLGIIQEKFEDKPYLLDEMTQLINRELPKPKRMSRRSLTHILTSLRSSGYFVFKRTKTNNCTMYEFSATV